MSEPTVTAADAKKLRWGIVGCGQIAYDRVMPALALAANSELVALFDPDPARLERAHESAPTAFTHVSLDGLLGDQSVDAVYIATPNHLHAEQTLAAAAAGKHILVEKPMALDAAQGQQMVEAAQRAGVKLMAAYMTLFNPAFRAARRLAASGALGEIVAVRGRHSYPMAPESLSDAALWRLDPRYGGGPLLDVGVYSIFTLRELTGMHTRSVSATGALKRLHGKTEYDSIIFTYLTDDGTPGVIEANFTFGSSHYELEGTRGRLTLSGHVSQLIGGRLDAEIWSDTKPRQLAERISHEVVPAGLPEFANYLGEVAHFAECVLTGKEPIASGRIAAGDLQVADAVRESLRTGARVELSAKTGLRG
ncbi:MAG: Gfo/Idh/MocA family oxidoreductase, partial [Chloroflexia bacterium]|nr:Gfo/Idh/MocA family oxidoreductase [Chloroflexia bacterium]